MPPRKRTPSTAAERKQLAEEPPSGGQGEEQPKKRQRKPASKRAETLTEPETTDSGWTLQPPSLIYRNFTGESNSKIAAFDFDGTLALQKSSLQFPRDANDWTLYNKQVPEILKSLYNDGFKLVIFSNQGGIKSALKGAMAQKITDRVSNVLAAIGLDIPVVLASNKDDNRKPGLGMWSFFLKNDNQEKLADKSTSFFVGDAAGGTGDFSDSDKQFAENIGLAFKTPEEMFGKPDGKLKAKFKGSSGLNDDLANAFREYAQAQEIEGGNPFAIRAFNKAADIIAGHSSNIRAGKELAGIQGVGKGTISKIDEFLATGTLGGVKQDPEAAATKAAKTEAALKFL